MNPIVYVLTSPQNPSIEDSAYYIIGVFSTFDKAKDMANLRPDHCEILQWELDDKWLLNHFQQRLGMELKLREK